MAGSRATTFPTASYLSIKSATFEPFYTTKTEGVGIGMGLAIARTIVEAHGGRMAAENNVWGGATVWFSVPARRNAP